MRRRSLASKVGNCYDEGPDLGILAPPSKLGRRQCICQPTGKRTRWHTVTDKANAARNAVFIDALTTLEGYFILHPGRRVRRSSAWTNHWRSAAALSHPQRHEGPSRKGPPFWIARGNLLHLSGSSPSSAHSSRLSPRHQGQRQFTSLF